MTSELAVSGRIPGAGRFRNVRIETQRRSAQPVVQDHLALDGRF